MGRGSQTNVLYQPRPSGLRKHPSSLGAWQARWLDKYLDYLQGHLNAAELGEEPLEETFQAIGRCQDFTVAQRQIELLRIQQEFKPNIKAICPSFYASAISNLVTQSENLLSEQFNTKASQRFSKLVDGIVDDLNQKGSRQDSPDEQTKYQNAKHLLRALQGSTSKKIDSESTYFHTMAAVGDGLGTLKAKEQRINELLMAEIERLNAALSEASSS